MDTRYHTEGLREGARFLTKTVVPSPRGTVKVKILICMTYQKSLLTDSPVSF